MKTHKAPKAIESSLGEQIAAAIALELRRLHLIDDVSERLAILDRAIKFEALQRKSDKDEWGSAFNDDGGE